MTVCIVHRSAPEIVKERSRYFIGANNILVQRNGRNVIVNELAIYAVKIYHHRNEADQCIRIDVITLLADGFVGIVVGFGVSIAIAIAIFGVICGV